MNAKLIVGIILPLVVIIVLVALSSVEVGYSLETSNEEEIQFEKLFSDTYRASEITVQTIRIKNDYFLPKKIELPRIIVCLNDREGLLKKQNMNVRYNEGSSAEIPEAPILSEIIESRPYYGYGSYADRRNVEVPAHSTRDVKVMVQPTNNYYNYDTQYGDYEYDEVLIVEPKEDKNNLYYSYSYDSCASLNDRDFENAVSIPISKPNATCSDTDNGLDYYVKGKIIYKNHPQDIRGEEDFCTDTFYLSERICRNPLDSKRNYQSFYCPNGCSDGACIGIIPTKIIS